MRIAQITHSYMPVTGGADVWVQMLREICEEMGHEVFVYQRPVQGVDDAQVRFIHSPLRALLGTRGEFWTVPFGLPALRQELQTFDALVVHYPNHHRMVEWHPRTVLVSHGVFWDDRPGSLRGSIKRGLACRAYQNATAVVANDTFFLREVGEDVLPDAKPFSEVAPGRWFIPNCVDAVRFSPTDPLPGLRNARTILVPRNVYRNRGIHLAIQAFAQVASELRDVRLAIVGAVGQPDYARDCQEMVSDLGLDARVVFFGPVPWAQMPNAYSAGELTLIPTLCGEGTSLAALESMACGVATITTNVAGLADLPAVKCEPGADSLAEAIREVWPRRENIAATQQRVVREVYNLGNWRAAWAEIVRRLENGG